VCLCFLFEKTLHSFIQVTEIYITDCFFFLLFFKVQEMTTEIEDIDTPEQVSENFDTLLCTAVRKGHDRMVEMLLEHGASPNGSAKTVIPPLSVACKNEADVLVKLLLSYEANANYVSEQADPALIELNRTLGRDHLDIVHLLLKSGANVDIRTKKTRKAYMRCVERNTNRTKPVFKECQTRSCTALMEASNRGNLSVVMALLEAGAEPTLADSLGNTALHHAVHCYSPKIATIDRQFHIVRHRSFPEVVEALISHGSSVDKVNNEGLTALDITFLHLDLLAENHQYHLQYKLDAIMVDYFQTIHKLIQAGCQPPTQMQFLILPWEISIYCWYSGLFFKSLCRDFWQEILSDREMSNLRAAFASVVNVTALSGVKLTSDDVTMLSENVPESFEDDFRSMINWLSRFSQNCLSLKQMCVITLRQVIKKPLIMTIKRRDLVLPRRINDYILLKDMLNFC
jgi:ankyrin repeat protein